MPSKIIFFGSSAHSVTILAKLLTLPEFSVVAVVTKQDKPVGRSQAITPNPVAKYAVDNHLNLLQISEFTSDLRSTINDLHPDVGLCVAFGPPFFDDEMIALPKHKIVNIHPSPLPKYRGATPGPWQIINGETTSAVTFFQIDALPDHGPIIAQIPFTIAPDETSFSFYDKAFALASEHLSTILTDYLQNPTKLSIQDHLQKSYYPKFTKDTARLDWDWSHDKISRFIRAMLPWPTAWTQVRDQQGKVLIMKVLSYDREPILVQVEGKKPTSWNQIKPYYQIINSHN